MFEIPTPAAPEFVDERHTMEAVVPARSLDELEENIRKARQAFAEAKTGGENVRSDNEAALADHQRKVELHDGPIQLRRAANANPARADLRWQLPQLAVRKGRVVGDGTVKVVVTSVDFVNVRPAYFAAHNNELRIVQENGVITLTNRSDHYVTVDAVSLYHQAKILTQSNSADGLLELPPQSVSTLRLASFDLHSLEDDYRQFDVRKAERESVKYGFGVKYRMTGAGVSKVLYKTDDYDLLPLL